MGLISARNLQKAKALLDQNRHMVGDVVGKAAVQLDKLSGGKTSDATTKIEQAARRYSASAIGPDGKPVGDKPLISASHPEPSDVIDVDAVEADAPPAEPASENDARS